MGVRLLQIGDSCSHDHILDESNVIYIFSLGKTRIRCKECNRLAAERHRRKIGRAKRLPKEDADLRWCPHCKMWKTKDKFEKYKSSQQGLVYRNNCKICRLASDRIRLKARRRVKAKEREKYRRILLTRIDFYLTHGYSYRTLSLALGVSESSINNWRKRHKKPMHPKKWLLVMETNKVMHNLWSQYLVNGR